MPKGMGFPAHRLRNLSNALKIKTGSVEVQPVVRNAIIKLNRLPFAYTWDSFGDKLVTLDKSRRTLSLGEAEKMEKVNFASSFIAVELDRTSPDSGDFFFNFFSLF